MDAALFIDSSIVIQQEINIINTHYITCLIELNILIFLHPEKLNNPPRNVIFIHCVIFASTWIVLRMSEDINNYLSFI